MKKETNRFNEKRKWQIALRRYVIEEKAAPAYAPYFGLDVQGFRKWIELQFANGLNWQSFGSAWQFDHIVPVAYFDFDSERDLKLCWNFINIRVEAIDKNKNRGNRVDVIAVKKYFEDLHAKTGYTYCQQMLTKIDELEIANIESNDAIENFIIENKTNLETIALLTPEEFAKLNSGTSVQDIILEREVLKKFGS